MVMYPVSSADGGAWLDPDNMVRFARAAERAGFDAIGLTDHPAPTRRWLESGGHETLDPFVGLATFAAATTHIRVITRLIVLPYRNPLLLARSMTSLDIVSRGRATYVVGAGYLRSEFAALGVDFAERNDLFDEAIEVLRKVWADGTVAYEGRHFSASGQVMTPAPVQRPHPPLWIGGNGARARERVARWGSGWSPMRADAALARTSRTAVWESNRDLERMIADLAERLEAHGRQLSDVDIHVPWEDAPASVEERIDHVETMAALGVTWSDTNVRGMGVSEAVEHLDRFGAEVIGAQLPTNRR